ncbi:5-(carboxyamino)imidazole ribonucleotide synthase [Bacillus marinisedimentorum]|uniref:5-(carboxyamino)imidazole ribonucleotide synthase n=1 Tax=Bacillus marinisedimentorum TaxID=1821260 RepID=UPI000872747C|nr:5-(carboxyamino)imidazole ribonucleotide synthase [Bacillus marinisedimentorum]
MNNKIIAPGATIGILGGGQLGRMMAVSAKEMGYRVAVLEAKEDSPCAQVADYEIIGAYDDLGAAARLAKISDIITYEFENIPVETVKFLEGKTYVPQGHDLLEITQHRGREKEALTRLGVKVAPYRLVNTKEQLTEAAADIGFPSVLKTCRGGYDGKGQFVMKTENDLNDSEVVRLLDQGECVLESWVDFSLEMSVIVSRGVCGEVKTFPAAENIHRDNILFESIVPARVPDKIKEKAARAAFHIAASLDMIGTLGVEMFIGKDGEVYINELAPRPHNSGHYTIDACETSQFQQHVRAICGWPLGPTDLLKPAVMVNILGEDLENVIRHLNEFSDIKFHLYGKAEAKQKRKMGHYTILNTNLAKAIEKAQDLIKKTIGQEPQKIGGNAE